ncbi:ECF transporter S component [uncultured Lactobacillus sp.]|uniref:ECF transporter S component n=1 Tax=uncultured Lactobacillus sp. TaxID=153152 RepID=UPI0025E33310|nr:ECF transporter S component [uncultured Lactobacillus sp.]
MVKEDDFSLKQLVLLALLTAINVVVSRIFIIPMPLTHGNINLCDAIIYLVALLYGPVAGGIVGGLSGFLLDLLGGYGQFMLFSLVVHGLEGFFVGLVFRYWNLGNQIVKAAVAGAIGVLLMVTGYFVTNTVLYTFAAGFASLFTNTIQGVVGVVIAIVLLPSLQHLMARYG